MLSAIQASYLVLLTLQNAALALVTRYTRSRVGVVMYYSTTAVLMGEVFKLVICLVALLLNHGAEKARREIYQQVFVNKWKMVLVLVPAVCYTVQNCLLYVAISNLDTGTYQVTYQMKILTAAAFSVCMLKKQLTTRQWIFLVTLALGVVLVQISTIGAKTPSETQSPLVGFLAAAGATLLSGFAGVFFEMLLKQENEDMWMKNLQMALLSIPLAIVQMRLKEPETFEQPLLYGFDFWVYVVVSMNSCGGLLVAKVMQVADNILKGMATSLAIVVAYIASYLFLDDANLSPLFLAGAATVVGSAFCYQYKSGKPTPPVAIAADAALRRVVSESPPPESDSKVAELHQPLIQQRT